MPTVLARLAPEQPLIHLDSEWLKILTGPLLEHKHRVNYRDRFEADATAW